MQSLVNFKIQKEKLLDSDNKTNVSYKVTVDIAAFCIILYRLSKAYKQS